MEALQIITTFFKDFISILSEMSPFLLLGFFFAGLLHAFIPRRKIDKYFNGKPLKSSFLASIFGVPLPLCSCGVIPTGTALYKNGASKGGTISFLISTPQTGVDSILATFSLLGLPFAIIRPFAALITGISGGIITSVITQNEQDTKAYHQQEESKKTLKEKLVDTLKYGFVDFIQDISKWLVIGLIFAAILSAIIPDDFFTLLNLPPFIQMLIILVVSVPLYICATGSIPLAAVLILKGISPGAAFVLLMAGPATNAATMTVIGKVLGKRSLFSYLATIIIGALTFGIAIDYLFPVEWFTQTITQHMGHSHSTGLSWWQISSAIILTALIINGYIQRYFSKNKKSEHQEHSSSKIMKTQIIKVEGMTCNHCKNNVETNLKNLDFIDNAEVNLADKTVTLKGESIDIEKVKKTIDQLGYKNIED